MRNVARDLGAAAAVNAVLQAPRWAAGGGPLHLPAPAPELILAAVVVVLARGTNGSAAPGERRGVAPVRLVCAAILALLSIFAVGETFTRAIYAEGFRPREELAFLPAFVAMVGVPRPLARSVVLLPIVALAWLALARLAYRGLAVATRYPVRSRRKRARRATLPRAALWALAIGVVGAGAASEIVAGPALSIRLVRALTPSRARFVTPPAFGSAAEAVPVQLRGREAGTHTPREVVPPPGARDLTIIVVESYGRTVFTHPAHRERLAPLFARLDRSARDRGYRVRSGFLRSPAFGGRSWLADATILTGQWIADQSLYEQMFHSVDWSVVTAARDAGVVSFYSAPGTTYYEHGWQTLFPFDHSYIAGQHGYRGPVFDFGRLTDQYLLHHLAGRRAALAPDRAALLVAILVSNHVPFRVVPPYVPDWNRLGDGSVYHNLERRTFENRWLSGGEYAHGFAAGIEYSLQSAFGYVTEHARSGEVVIIVGDHQPRRPVSEERPTTMVPFHLITRTAARLQPFEALATVDGWTPQPVERAQGLDVLAPLIARALAVDRAGAARGDE